MESQEQIMEIESLSGAQSQEQIFKNQSQQIVKFVHANTSQNNNEIIQKSQLKKVTTYNLWTNAEQFRFLVFMTKFKQEFKNYSVNSKGLKLRSNRFELMSKFIKTKTTRQCKDKHLSLKTRYQTYDAIILRLKQKVFISTSEAFQVLANIKKFKRAAYSKDINQCLDAKRSQSPQIYKLILKNLKINPNQSLFKSQNHVSFDSISLKEQIIAKIVIISEVQNNTYSENQVAYESIDLEPNTLDKTLKQQINIKNTFKQYPPDQEQENYAENFQKQVEEKGSSKRKQKSDQQSFNSYTTEYLESLPLYKFIALEKSKGQKCIFWTFYEKYKFTMYWAIHKDSQTFDNFFSSVHFFNKLAQFIGTNKSVYQCYSRVQQMLKKYQRNRQRFVEEEMKLYKISPQRAQRQKMIELSKQSQYISVGNCLFKAQIKEIHKFIDANTYQQIINTGSINYLEIDFSFHFNELHMAFLSQKVKAIPIKIMLEQALKEDKNLRPVDPNKSDEAIFQEDQQNRPNENANRITLKQVIKEPQFKKLKQAFLIEDQKSNQGIYAERIRELSEINLQFQIVQSIRLIKKL